MVPRWTRAGTARVAGEPGPRAGAPTLGRKRAGTRTLGGRRRCFACQLGARVVQCVGKPGRWRWGTTVLGARGGPGLVARGCGGHPGRWPARGVRRNKRIR
ncbi:hypothetical protein GUJ93_ZPchr0003g18075 [Zizania palustris]|uniref:Uncharacterized protein n=1 Tax=Zizania palustris TaxID=103762 RepID=A0A8J5SC91_ZIZPA|nr:hypothetical protein GUJ93_ZPchr0003g18075 [Zizania palustris]